MTTNRFSSQDEYRRELQLIQDLRHEIENGSDAILLDEIPKSTSTVSAMCSETDLAFRSGYKGINGSHYFNTTDALVSAWNRGFNYRNRINKSKPTT